jgi:hypothetical protein
MFSGFSKNAPTGGRNENYLITLSNIIFEKNIEQLLILPHIWECSACFLEGNHPFFYI